MMDYRRVYKQFPDDPRTFWAAAAEALHRHKPCTEMPDGTDKPFHQWFPETAAAMPVPMRRLGPWERRAV